MSTGIKNRRLVKQQRFAVRVDPEALALAERIAKANGQYGVTRAEVLANWIKTGAALAGKRWTDSRDGGPMNATPDDLKTLRVQQQAEEVSVSIHMPLRDGGRVPCGGCGAVIAAKYTWRVHDSEKDEARAACIHCASPRDYAIYTEARDFRGRGV